MTPRNLDALRVLVGVAVLLWVVGLVLDYLGGEALFRIRDVAIFLLIAVLVLGALRKDNPHP